MTVKNLAGTFAQSTTSSSVAPGFAGGGGGGASRSGSGSHATASSSRGGGGARPKLGAQQGQPQAQ